MNGKESSGNEVSDLSEQGKQSDQIDSNPSINSPFKDREIIINLLVFCTLALLIYALPTYVIVEQVTRDGVYFLLVTFGFPANLASSLINPNTPLHDQIGWEAMLNQGILTGWPGWFPEAIPEVTGVFMPSTDLMEAGNYWIVKACTGMQAGAVLLAIIAVTKGPSPSKKLQAMATFLALLTVTNILRIAFHLALVNYGIPFFWAPDVLSKPIGFFCTLLFAYIIEKQGVPIIDTFAEWMEWGWYRISKPSRTIKDVRTCNLAQNKGAVLFLGFGLLGLLIFLGIHGSIVSFFMYQPDLNLFWGRTLYGFLYRSVIEFVSTGLYFGLVIAGGGIVLYSVVKWFSGIFERQPIESAEVSSSSSETSSSGID